MPRSSATTWNIPTRIGAVALAVTETDTWSSGMPSKMRARSSTVATDTPARPTSPAARGSSGSIPIWVGRSKAIDRPVWPRSSRYRNRPFVSSEVPKPAYWRIVQVRPRYMVAKTPRR